MPVNDVYSLEEAAAELELSLGGIRKAAERGRLVTHKLGSQRVVTGDEIARYRRENLGKVGQPRKHQAASEG